MGWTWSYAQWQENGALSCPPKMVPDLTNLSLMEEIDMKQSSRNEPQIVNTVHINAQRGCSGGSRCVTEKGPGGAKKGVFSEETVPDFP